MAPTSLKNNKVLAFLTDLLTVYIIYWMPISIRNLHKKLAVYLESAAKITIALHTDRKTELVIE